jgi:anti-sigma B factor antagonist
MPTAAEPSSAEAQLISTVSRVEHTICITFAGQLDLVVEQELTAVVAATASTPEVAAMHLDLTQVTFIDSSGLRGLILSSQAALDRGLTFTIDVLEGGPVARLLDLTNLRGEFTHAKLAVPSLNGLAVAGGCERNQ